MTDDLTRRGPSATPPRRYGPHAVDHETNTVEEAARFERDREPFARWINGMPRDPDDVPDRDDA